MSMEDHPTRRVPVAELRALIERLLRSAGADEESATAAADGYLEADLRGHPMQGPSTTCTPSCRGSGRGRSTDTPTSAWSGRARALPRSTPTWRSATTAAWWRWNLAVRKAKTSGCCAVGLLNADDIFMLGYYADRFARAGTVGFVYTAAPGRRVSVAGGIEPVMWDQSLRDWRSHRRRAPGGVRHLHQRARGRRGAHRELPRRLAPRRSRDRQGRQSDHRRAGCPRGGLSSPSEAPRGYGLGLCGALLAGPLIGGLLGEKLEQVLENPTGHERARGHLFIAVEPSIFVEPAQFRKAVSAYLHDIGTSEKEPGFEEILIPGERGLRQRDESLEQGALIYESVWENTARLAREYGVSMPA